MNKKTAVNAILGIFALLVVVGLAVQFMPTGTDSVSGLVQSQKAPAALRVNGTDISTEQLVQIEQQNPSPFTAQGGVLADDFRTFLISRVVQQEVLSQAASDIDIPRADVDAEVETVRESQGLTDDAAWTDALQRVGLSDSEYREQVREGLAVQRKIEEIEASAEPASPEELQLYYDLNPTLFQTEPRIKGRQIVVADEAEAEALLAEAKAGADFEVLARESSKVNAENGGALGALSDAGALQAVETVVLPTAVAQSVQALGGAGIAGVTESGGQYYIVQVEEVLPPQEKPFDEVKNELQATLDERKKAAVVEDWLAGLTEGAEVEVLDDAWAYYNPTVAEIDGKAIPYSEVLGQVLQNQQMMMMQSMDAAQLGEMVNGMLKPSITEQLIQSYAAPAIVREQGAALVGTRDDLLAGLVAYGGRGATVSEAELQAAYDERRAQFETPASAVVIEATFDTREQALAFRQDWTGGDFTRDAGRVALVSERGPVGPLDGVLDPALAQAIFEGELRDVGSGSLSSAVETAAGWQVAYVTELRPAEVQPLSEVRDVLRSSLLNEKQGAQGQEFVAEQVAALNPVNNLEEVLAQQQARLEAAAPAEAEGSESEEGSAAEEGEQPVETASESTSGDAEAPAEGAAEGAGGAQESEE